MLYTTAKSEEAFMPSSFTIEHIPNGGAYFLLLYNREIADLLLGDVQQL